MKKYLTEVLLISDTDNLNNIIDWLYWHLYIIGFEHAVIIDNSKNSILNVLQNIPDFNNKIDYHSMPYSISQTGIYTEFVNKSEAWWVLPIDDDEYVYLNPLKYRNIQDVIREASAKSSDIFKIGFTWAIMLSDNLIAHIDYSNTSYIENFKNILCADCNSINYDTNIFGSKDDIKVMVNTCLRHLYDISDSHYITEKELGFRSHVNEMGISCYEHIGNVHNPITKYKGKYYFTYNISNDSMSLGYQSYYPINEKSDVLLLHFKYRTKDEWKFKCNSRNHFVDTKELFFTTQYLTERITDYYNRYSKYAVRFDTPLNVYYKYKEKINAIKNAYN